MYVNYVNNMRQLKYNDVKDNDCGIGLVVIVQPTVLLIRNLPSKVNRKTKRVILVIGLVSGVWFYGLESASAIGLPITPTPLIRVQPSLSLEHSLKKPEIAKELPRKPDRISYKCFSKSKEELLFLIYATDPRLSSNQQVLKIIKDLRGGNLEVVILVGAIILILSLSQGASFVPNNQNPGWGLDRPN